MRLTADEAAKLSATSKLDEIILRTGATTDAQRQCVLRIIHDAERAIEKAARSGRQNASVAKHAFNEYGRTTAKQILEARGFQVEEMPEEIHISW